VRVSFRYTADELACYWDEVTRASRPLFLIKVGGYVMPVGIAGAVLAASVLGHKPLLPLAVNAAPWLVLGCLFPLLLTRPVVRLISQWSQREPDVLEEREFSATGFRADGQFATALVPWSAVSTVEETGDLLVLRIGKDVHALPLRAVPAAHQRTIRSLIPAALWKRQPRRLAQQPDLLPHPPGGNAEVP
jgi:hypothetical protein